MTVETTAPASVHPLLIDVILDGKGAPRLSNLVALQQTLDLRDLMDAREAMIVAADARAAWSAHYQAIAEAEAK